MKFDLIIDKNEDLEQFKAMFYKLIESEQTTYNLYAGNVIIRVVTSNFKGNLLVAVSLFNLKIEGKSTSLDQFHPLADKRFRTFEVFIEGWKDSVSGSIHLHSSKTDRDAMFDSIREVVRTVYKFNKLKAFL